LVIEEPFFDAGTRDLLPTIPESSIESGTDCMPAIRLGHPVFFKNIPFEIEERQILREMRIPKKASLAELGEPAMEKAIRTAIEEGYRMIEGKGVYRTLEITGVEDRLVRTRETGTLFVGEKMVKLLKNCDYASLIVATIGPTIENEVDRLTGPEPAHAYFLERVGAWMADYMGIWVDKMLEREIIRAGYSRTYRFGVGYGDWPLSSQVEVMALTRADQIGLSLNEAFIMLPRLSVSAVIGWQRAGAGQTTTEPETEP